MILATVFSLTRHPTCMQIRGDPRRPVPAFMLREQLVDLDRQLFPAGVPR